MNNLISQVNISQSGNSNTDMMSGVSAGYNRQNDGDIGPSTADKDSFHNTMRKAYEDSGHGPKSAESEKSGNRLPQTDDSAEGAADNDRISATQKQPSQDAEQGTAGDNSCERKQDESSGSNPAAGSAPVDIRINNTSRQQAAILQDGQNPDSETGIAGNYGVLREQLQKQIKLDAAKNSGATLDAQSVTSNTATGNEKPAGLKAETATLNAEQVKAGQVSISTDKIQSFKAAIQQQIASANQAALSTQSSSESIRSDSQPVPLSADTLLNSSSTSALQALPKLEIAENIFRPAWSSGLGKQVVWMLNQNISSAEIRLNPAHLGPIKVRVDLNDDQVSVSLSSHHAAVREAMEQALPKLREMLDANGFNLAETDISHHSFAGQQEQNNERGKLPGPSATTDQPIISEINGQVTKTLKAAAGMVDYYI